MALIHHGRSTMTGIGGRAVAPKAGLIPVVSIPLDGTLWANKGLWTPEFAAATADRMVQNHLGRLKRVPAGAARFYGYNTYGNTWYGDTTDGALQLGPHGVIAGGTITDLGNGESRLDMSSAMDGMIFRDELYLAKTSLEGRYYCASLDIRISPDATAGHDSEIEFRLRSGLVGAADSTFNAATLLSTEWQRFAIIHGPFADNGLDWAEFFLRRTDAGNVDAVEVRNVQIQEVDHDTTGPDPFIHTVVDYGISAAGAVLGWKADSYGHTTTIDANQLVTSTPTGKLATLKGLLMEPEQTSLGAGKSYGVANTVLNLTAVALGAEGLDGRQSATQVRGDDSVNTHHLSYNAAANSAGARTMALQAIFKLVGAESARGGASDEFRFIWSEGNYRMSVNADTYALSTVTGTGMTELESGIEALADGFYRVYAVLSLDGTWVDTTAVCRYSFGGQASVNMPSSAGCDLWYLDLFEANHVCEAWVGGTRAADINLEDTTNTLTSRIDGEEVGAEITTWRPCERIDTDSPNWFLAVGRTLSGGRAIFSNTNSKNTQFSDGTDNAITNNATSPFARFTSALRCRMTHSKASTVGQVSSLNGTEYDEDSTPPTLTSGFAVSTLALGPTGKVGYPFILSGAKLYKNPPSLKWISEGS